MLGDPDFAFVQVFDVAVVEGEIGLVVMAIHCGTAASYVLVISDGAVLAEYVPAGDVIGALPLAPPVVSFVELQLPRRLLDRGHLVRQYVHIHSGGP